MKKVSPIHAHLCPKCKAGFSCRNKNCDHQDDFHGPVCDDCYKKAEDEEVFGRYECS